MNKPEMNWQNKSVGGTSTFGHILTVVTSSAIVHPIAGKGKVGFELCFTI